MVLCLGCFGWAVLGLRTEFSAIPSIATSVRGLGRGRHRAKMPLDTPNGTPTKVMRVDPSPDSAEFRDGTLEVRAVVSRSDRTAFVGFPWQIYAGNPQWVPPLEREVRQFIDPRHHPFLRHGSSQAFLAWRAGRVVGRIVASDDPNFNREHGTNQGAFGLFESVDDEAVARLLIGAAARWLGSRGRTRLWGPVDYSTNYQCGLLVDGFDTPPRFLMNHHPPYYASLLTSCGLTKCKDLYAYWFDDPNEIVNKWSRLAERLGRRGGFTVRAFDKRRLREDIAACKAVYNEAWERNWGFVKMTDAEFDYLANSLLPFAPPEMLLIAECEGRPIGFSMTLPDLNEAIRPLNGRLARWGVPWGAWQLWRGLRRISTARMLILGVVEAHRRRGVAELLILKTLEHGRYQARYSGAELGWTLEDNDLINSTIESVGGRRYKTYRVYDRAIDE